MARRWRGCPRLVHWCRPPSIRRRCGQGVDNPTSASARATPRQPKPSATTSDEMGDVLFRGRVGADANGEGDVRAGAGPDRLAFEVGDVPVAALGLGDRQHPRTRDTTRPRRPRGPLRKSPTVAGWGRRNPHQGTLAGRDLRVSSSLVPGRRASGFGPPPRRRPYHPVYFRASTCRRDVRPRFARSHRGGRDQAARRPDRKRPYARQEDRACQRSMGRTPASSSRRTPSPRTCSCRATHCRRRSIP